MRSRRGALLSILLLAVVVNLPLAHGAWQRAQLARDGVEVSALVLDDASPDGVLAVRLPAEVAGTPVTEAEREQQVAVGAETYEAALAAGGVGVRVLPDRPRVLAVVEEPSGTSGVLLGVTLLADLFLVVAALLAWRFAGRAPAAETEEPDDWPFHPDRRR